jgi:NADH-quinone oxidoreductase subunit J
MMVLVLFVIMLVKHSPRELGLMPQWGHAVLLGVIFLTVLLAMVFKDPGSGIVLKGAVAQPKEFGRFLFDRYWLAIEIVSILLLVALVTTLVVAKRRGTAGEEKQEMGEQP